MKHKRIIHQLTGLVVILTLLLGNGRLAGTAKAADQATDALAALQAESDGPLHIDYAAATGAARWIEAEGGVLTRQFARQNLTADAVALSFLTTYGSLFGVSDAANALHMTETETDDSGAQHVGFSQHQNGIEVFGTKVIVHVDAEGAVEVVNGYTVPNAATIDTTPTLDAQAVAQAAIAYTAIADGVAAESHLEIFNPGLITDKVTPTYLVYRIRVDSPTQPELAQWVFVDAHTGEIRDSYAAVTDARYRTTYTMNNGTAFGSAQVMRTEWSSIVPANYSCNDDINNAHDFAGNTYDFYKSRFGRDSYDGQGAAIKSYACYDKNYRNAYWDGSAKIMVYGAGFPADDVVGHELSHAVTQYISGLVYSGQSGGLNESFSDIMGESIDLTNGRGNDATSVRWDMGEDITGIGAIRDMMDPERFRGNQGTAGEWICNTNVHYSSAVQNKAFALMVDGGTYNGYTISPIGLDKAVQIIYRANDLYLPSTAKFVDAYSANNRSCSELYGATSDTCVNVQKALLATNMNGAICGELAAPSTLAMVNADFELGINKGWSEYDSTGYITVHQGAGENGSWGAWMGGFHNETNEIWQKFSVPTNGSTLFYSYRIDSEDWPRFDYAYVLVNDVDMGAYMLCSECNTNGFRPSWLNLSAYAGQVVTLKFRFKSDNSLTSNFFLDNFRFGPSTFADVADPNLVTDVTQADAKPEGMPGTVVTGKEDQSAPQLPVDMAQRIFLPIIQH